MQGSTLSQHYAYSNSLRGHQIPEEETMDYNYHSSSSSNTSLEDNDESNGLQYPTENLGTSWGSYLHSGPPTRAGLAGVHRRLLRDAVNIEHDQKNVEGIMRHKPQAVLVDPGPSEQIRSILDTPQPTATSTPKRDSPKGQLAEYSPYHKADKIPSSNTVTLPRNSLLMELKRLMEVIHSSHLAITGNGMNSDQLKSLLDTTQKAYSTLKQLTEESGNDTGTEVLSSGVLSDIIRYLTEVLKALVEQSQKLKQDAESIHRSGRQLSRNQEQYFREQREIHEAIEEARVQLNRERVSFNVVSLLTKANVVIWFRAIKS